MFTISRRKLLAKAFINYSVVGLATLVVGQFQLVGTERFSFLFFIGGAIFTISWLALAFVIEPEERGN